MKKILISLLMGMVLSAPAFADTNADLKQSRQLIQKLGKGLKKELVTAMKADGPVHAIGVCNLKAPLVALSVSTDKINVGRTSLKTRNQKNTPDSWEKNVLLQFEKRKQNGEDPAKMDFSEKVVENGVSKFRYMKAISTAKVCLNCHGSSLKPKVASKLDQLYPADQARGFSEGDIRGAFTVIKNLD